MINPKELMIGNWVWRIFAPYGVEKDRWYQQIKTGIEIDNQTLPSSYLKPIILTPDIIEKSGFTLHSKHSFWNYTTKNGFHISMWAKDKPCAGFEEEGVFYWGETPDVTLRYLHQLQNLYYFLTNKELQITL